MTGPRLVWRADAAADESGESPVTAVFGVAIFLLFLLLAAQTLVYLYTASVVQAAAVDGAQLAAADGATSSQRAQGLQRARGVLGGLADEADISFSSPEADAAGTQLGLSVTVPNPAILPGRLGIAEITREASVRVEEGPA